mmetsp:Transcript_11787/g.25982  ORF Transcript_11787/g.25982 Transcript_11787/m.25982 type:complete len:274 (-) Transcript_11787:36-857(-)
MREAQKEVCPFGRLRSPCCCSCCCWQRPRGFADGAVGTAADTAAGAVAADTVAAAFPLSGPEHLAPFLGRRDDLVCRDRLFDGLFLCLVPAPCCLCDCCRDGNLCSPCCRGGLCCLWCLCCCSADCCCRCRHGSSRCLGSPCCRHGLCCCRRSRDSPPDTLYRRGSRGSRAPRGSSCRSGFGSSSSCCCCCCCSHLDFRDLPEYFCLARCDGCCWVPPSGGYSRVLWTRRLRPVEPAAVCHLASQPPRHPLRPRVGKVLGWGERRGGWWSSQE